MTAMVLPFMIISLNDKINIIAHNPIIHRYIRKKAKNCTFSGMFFVNQQTIEVMIVSSQSIVSFSWITLGTSNSLKRNNIVLGKRRN
jgi:hypothetical protein